jgi:exonuclease VII large subunit
VFERGFSMVRSASGQIVRNSTEISLGETLAITFAQGRAEASVTRKEDEA